MLEIGAKSAFQMLLADINAVAFSIRAAVVGVSLAPPLGPASRERAIAGSALHKAAEREVGVVT